MNYCSSDKTIILFYVSHPAAAAAEALAVLQVGHAQQERGQLLPAQQRRIPPPLGCHCHAPHPAAATLPSPLLRVPSSLRALAEWQSRPVAVVALTLGQPHATGGLQGPAQVSGPAPHATAQDSLFPGARLPQAHQLPAMQTHDPR